MSGVTLTVCAQCGAEFKPKGFGWKFCSSACRNQANKLSVRQHMTAAIVPSEQKPIRTKPMTDEEFEAMYWAIRRELMQRGDPLYDYTKGGYAEKAEREAAHNARQTQQNRAGREKGTNVVKSNAETLSPRTAQMVKREGHVSVEAQHG